MYGRRMMLISNSFCYGMGYLEHCAAALKEFLGPINRVTFVPYALRDWDKYTTTAREGFAKMGIEVIGIHKAKGSDVQQALLEAEAIFVGGGNTFRLLRWLYGLEIMGVIAHQVVIRGVPYMGASAGVNVACPTIMTTNDMPIVQLMGFGALELFPWQINPHYVDADSSSKHMGETREARIAEYHEENDAPVVGLREGSWIRVESGVATLEGKGDAKLFFKGEVATEWRTGEERILPIG